MISVALVGGRTPVSRGRRGRPRSIRGDMTQVEQCSIGGLAVRFRLGSERVGMSLFFQNEWALKPDTSSRPLARLPGPMLNSSSRSYDWMKFRSWSVAEVE